MSRNGTSAGIEHEKNDEREYHHATGEPVRLGVFERLDVIEDLHGHDARAPRNIAADHQDDAEFAYGMCEAENRRRDDARSRTPASITRPSTPRACNDVASKSPK